MGTIVVSYVDTPEGRAALGRAESEARLRGLPVVVIDARRTLDPDPEPVPDTEPADDGGGAGHELARFRERLTADGPGCEIRALAQGADLADVLIDTAVDTGAELIVIGLRRRSPVGKLILGTNAQRIMLDSSCPVLTVKVDP
ncbi:MAG TPA: universal stress protein [Actinopolymorphaceae bacterium]